MNEIEQLKHRNERVEADKAWEMSKTRKAAICVMTYFVIVLFLWSIDVASPWVNAIVPVIGFFISTLTLSYFKNVWLSHWYKK